MKIPQALPQFKDTETIIVVIASERGVLYKAVNGTIDEMADMTETAPQYSDREGFFMRSGGGMQYGSGEPYDDTASADHKKLIDQVVDELQEIVNKNEIKKLYLFEPEHHKGQLTEALKVKIDIPATLVDFGNFIETDALVLLEKINKFENPPYDPSDPSSVEGKENAEEKRKILEVGKKLEQ